MPKKSPNSLIDQAGAKWHREEALRQCEVAYITDERQRSADYWWDQLCKQHISIQHFYRRAKLQRWRERRDAYWEEITQSILRQTQYKTIHDRVQDLQRTLRMLDDAAELVSPVTIDGRKIFRVPPKSLEGMINAIVKLETLVETKRERILSAIEPQMRRDLVENESSDFTNDEMRSVVRFLLEKRKEAQAKQITEGAQDGNGNAKPEQD